MSVSTYFLLGVLFMFSMDVFLKSKPAQKHINTKIPNFGFWEIIIGISLWPLLIVIFLYNFFKQLFK